MHVVERNLAVDHRFQATALNECEQVLELPQVAQRRAQDLQLLVEDPPDVGLPAVVGHADDGGIRVLVDCHVDPAVLQAGQMLV
ncbi:MAG: hypothetical protein RJA10_596, partial [Pseudomonadota bacterium]